MKEPDRDGGEQRRPRRVLIVLLALAVLAELAMTLHPHFAIEALFGFRAWFALLATLVLAAFALALARVLARPAAWDEPADD